MQAWADFWSIVMVVGFTLFAVVSLTVTIIGYRDVQQMFRSIEHKHRRDDSPDDRTEIGS